MTTPKPDTGKKPADHKQDAEAEHEARLAIDELLAGMPDLTPPHKLRYRQRAMVKRIIAKGISNGAFRSEEEEGGEADGSSVAITLDLTNEDDVAKLNALYDVCADIDDFARSIAVDPDAWDEWSSSKDEETFVALITTYSDAVGESNGS